MLIIVNSVHIICICLIYDKCKLVQLCIKQNGNSYLCTTGPQLVLGSEARNRRYLKMCIFSMNTECECRVLIQLNISLIRFLEFTVDHKLQLHLSENELFVHKEAHELCKKYPSTSNGQGTSWLIHEHYLLEWFMNSSSHTDIAFTWIVHEQVMWMWYLCGMNYSWTIPVNGSYELIMNCPGPFDVHGHSLNISWALMWTVHEIFINIVHE